MLFFKLSEFDTYFTEGAISGHFPEEITRATRPAVLSNLICLEGTRWFIFYLAKSEGKEKLNNSGTL